MNAKAVCLAAWVMLSAGVSLLMAAEAPKTGDKAPGIVAKDQDGKEWKLENFAGKKAGLVYFYPKDDTPGCTKQACGLRDEMEQLKAGDVEVTGVSFDSAESHRAFIEKHRLNFTLLADPEGKIADAYGVRAPGQSRARRVSFLIGKDGRILHVTDTPAAEVHLQEMKAAVAKLQQGKAG